MHENHQGTKQISDRVYNAHFDAGLRANDGIWILEQAGTGEPGRQ